MPSQKGGRAQGKKKRMGGVLKKLVYRHKKSKSGKPDKRTKKTGRWVKA